MSNSFVSFYDSNEVIPVHQPDFDSVSHLRRWSRLYRMLGCPLDLVEGKRVLEVGAGTGDNADLTLKYEPSRYHLFDSSAEVLKQLVNRFDSEVTTGKCSFIDGDMNSFDFEADFDFVIAEACIPGQARPIKALRNVAKAVASKGHLIITTQSANSLLSEILRRTLALQLRSTSMKIEEWADICASTFKSNFDSLINMSRQYEDWIWDVLIHPWHNGSQVFTIPDAVESLEKEFEILGVSPDWGMRDHWYKEDVQPISSYQQQIVQLYERANYLLMDNRKSMRMVTEVDLILATKTSSYTSRIYNLHMKYSKSLGANNKYLQNLQETCLDLAKTLFKENTFVANCLFEFVDISRGLHQNSVSSENIFIDTQFKDWWGRGMQYCAFRKLS